MTWYWSLWGYQVFQSWSFSDKIGLGDLQRTPLLRALFSIVLQYRYCPLWISVVYPVQNPFWESLRPPRWSSGLGFFSKWPRPTCFLEDLHLGRYCWILEAQAVPEAALVLRFVTIGCSSQILTFRIACVPTSSKLQKKHVSLLLIPWSPLSLPKDVVLYHSNQATSLLKKSSY